MLLIIRDYQYSVQHQLTFLSTVNMTIFMSEKIICYNLDYKVDCGLQNSDKLNLIPV